MENTFREGSKSHSIMESINKGETYDKIVDTMKLKNKHDIYVAVSKNRKNIKLRKLQKQADPAITEDKTRTEKKEPASKNIPGYTAEMAEMRNQIGDLSKMVTSLTGDTGKPLGLPASVPVGSEEKMEVAVEPSMKQIGTWVYAKNLVLFDFAKRGSFDGALRNFSGNWSDFVNLVLESYFSDKFNAAVGLMRRELA